MVSFGESLQSAFQL